MTTKKNESGNQEASVRFLRDEIALKDAAISKNEKKISALKEELKAKDETIKALIEQGDFYKKELCNLNDNIIRLSTREKELLAERKALAEIHENNLEEERLATKKERSAHADTKKWTRIIFWSFIATIITAGFFLKNDLSQKKEIDRLNTIIHAKESNPNAE